MHIRFSALVLMFLMISSVAEMVSWFEDDGVEGGSWFVASLVILASTLVVAWAGWQFFKSQYNFTFHRMVYFREFFRGIRIRWTARAYPFMNFIRKYILVLISVGLYQAKIKTKLPFFMSMQLIYLISFWATFPFTEIKDNIIEIIWELVYTILIAIVIRCHDKNGLTSSVESWFKYIIVTNIWCAVWISIGRQILIISI